jgi:hypothetical protein
MSRNTLAAFLLSTATLLPSQGSANFTITLDTQYSRVLTHGATLGHWNGFGGTLFLEVQPVDFLSFGLAGNFTSYFGLFDDVNPTTFSAYADGVLRVMPLGRTGRVSPYLLGTFGWNPLSVTTFPGWSGDLHGQAGLGVRWQGDATSAMDLGISYQFFTPTADPLQTLTAHIGFTFFTEPYPLGKGREGKAIPRYDSLQAVAAREYGDPDLYPILLDANFKDKAKPLTWKAGTPLLVPRPLTPAMIREAKAKARDPFYLKAASTFRDPFMSEEARKAARESGSYWVPVTGKKRSSIPFHAQSLYDVAARSDVYGDPELYPLLVDANRARLRLNYPYKPFTLIIPRPTKEQVGEARLKAWSVEYGLWRGKDVTREDYRDWRDKHGKWVGP